MNKRCHTKIVRVGESVAEIEVEMMETDEGWSHYLSLEAGWQEVAGRIVAWLNERGLCHVVCQSCAD